MEKFKELFLNESTSVWYDWGVNEQYYKLADNMMEEILPIVKKYKSKISENDIKDFLSSIVKEAIFQVYELPKKNKEYQEKKRWKKS